MSDKGVVLIASNTINLSFSGIPDRYVQTPDNIADDVIDLFVQRHGYNHNSGNKEYAVAKKNFKDDIKKDMMKYKTYFMMDEAKDETGQSYFKVGCCHDS